MDIDFRKIGTADFRTDESSDNINDEFKTRLGMEKRYLPARLAIAKSLAASAPVELLAQSPKGRAIKGDVLFGTGPELSCWLILLTEHSGQEIADVKTLKSLVAAHWRRGIHILDQEWQNVNGDFSKFIFNLADVAGLASGAMKPDVPDGYSSAVVTASIGNVEWAVNGQGGSPHCAIMGGVGSGKTTAAARILKDIRRQVNDVPLFAFDFKGDLGTDENGSGFHLDQTYGANIVAPPQQPVPLDVLALASHDQIAIDTAAISFRESFGRLKGCRLGDRQRDILHDAVVQSLQGNNPCELRHIKDKLEEIYDDREIKEDSVISTMRDVCRFSIFEPTYDAETFFSKSWMVKLPPNIPADIRSIVVNLTLDALDRYLNSLPDTSVSESDGSRRLRILCVVDEAHYVLKTKLPSLSTLVRLSRSKGSSIMLISQSPDDFSKVEDDFLSEMGLVVAFRSNASAANISRIFGKKSSLAKLKTGECYVKVSGESSAKKVTAGFSN